MTWNIQKKRHDSMECFVHIVRCHSISAQVSNSFLFFWNSLFIRPGASWLMRTKYTVNSTMSGNVGHWSDRQDEQWIPELTGRGGNHYIRESAGCTAQTHYSSTLFYKIFNFIFARNVGMSNNKINSSHVEMYRLCTFTKHTRHRVHIT
jgi:hypothetical protein